MIVTISFKVEAETRDELMHHLGARYQMYRQAMEAMAHAGAFILPLTHLNFRWLVVGGQWRQPVIDVVPEPDTESEVPHV